MRLIDADEFKTDVSEEVRKNTWVLIRTIDDAPTVKAVPVEYIQKWNNNYIADTMRNGRTIINQMLDDWEKENEID